MAHDVALLHGGHEAVVKMQVRAAYAGAGDFYDRITRIQDCGIRHRLHAHLLYAHITNCFHASLLRAANVSFRLDRAGIGRVGSATLMNPVIRSRLPSDWPSIVGTSPASIIPSRRRRSWRMAKLAPLFRKFASVLLVPRDGLYSMWTSIRVPRPAGAGRKSTVPSTWMSESGRDCQEICSFSRSFVISASQWIDFPPGPIATHRERRSSSLLTVSSRFMNRGKFSKSRQKRYTSWGVQLIRIVAEAEDSGEDLRLAASTATVPPPAARAMPSGDRRVIP